MLDFIRKAFRVLFVIALWFIPIAMAIAGAVGGASGGAIVGVISSGSNDGGQFLGGFLGFIAGAVAGILIDIFMGGLIAILLNIDENLEIIKDKALRIGASSFMNSSGTKLADISPVSPLAASGETWVCKKCGESNPASSSTCKGCGEYK